jgi:short-subunit dehydrogenase
MKTNNKTLWWLVAGAGAFLLTQSAVRRLNAYSFKDKVVLITGGSRGLGLVMARLLANEGAKLVLVARDDLELENARFELAGKGANVIAIKCDVTDQEQVNNTISNVQNKFGPIDVLINNAGVIHVGPVEEMEIKEFEEAMDTHFWGSLYTMLAVLPIMKARREGHILNVASIGGKISVPHLVPYSASKFALVGLSEGLRAELSQYNISITTATPGLIRTGSPRHAFVKGQHRKEYALFKILDSSVLTSMSAEATAKRLIDGLRYGEAEVITTLPAKTGALIHGLSPALITTAFSLINKLLPGRGGIGKSRAKGYESESNLSESSITERTQVAAQNNNEV